MAEEEKLEFLKHEEVKTMQKDLAKLREAEAETERGKISNLKTEEEAKKERERLEIIRKEAEEREKAIPVAPTPPIPPSKPALALPKISIPKVTVPKITVPKIKVSRPPAWLEKLLVRITMILFWGFIITFAYWYFFARETKPEEQLPQTPSQIIISPEKKLAALSLKEKVGQLFIIGFEGKELSNELKTLFEELKPGGVILFSKNIENKEQVKKLIKDIQALSALPLFVAVDQEGGIVSRVPFIKEQTPQNEIKNTDEAFRVGLDRGKELLELGFNLNLAPVLDELKPGDFLYPRAFLGDIETIGELGKAVILGQKTAGIFSAVKHFPGYGGINFDPEEKAATIAKTPTVSQFQKAIEANPEFVMAANVTVTEIDPQKRFFFSEKGINFLKQKLPRNYLIMTDDLSQNTLSKFSLKNRAVTPIISGADIVLFTDFRNDPKETMQVLLQAAKSGDISEERINQSVLKIIKLKEELK